jgi:hypothetical protein
VGEEISVVAREKRLFLARALHQKRAGNLTEEDGGSCTPEHFPNSSGAFTSQPSHQWLASCVQSARRCMPPIFASAAASWCRS